MTDVECLSPDSLDTTAYSGCKNQEHRLRLWPLGESESQSLVLLKWVTAAVLTSGTLAALGIYPSYRGDLEDNQRLTQLRQLELVQILLYQYANQRCEEKLPGSGSKRGPEEARADYNATAGDMARFQLLVDHQGGGFEEILQHSTGGRVQSTSMKGSVPQTYLSFPDWPEPQGEPRGPSYPTVLLVEDQRLHFSVRQIAVTMLIAGLALFLASEARRILRQRSSA